MTDTEKLDEYGCAPCPFCGNPYSDGGVYPANRDETLWTVACGNIEGCGARIDGPTRSIVLDNWNRRAKPPLRCATMCFSLQCTEERGHMGNHKFDPRDP